MLIIHLWQKLIELLKCWKLRAITRKQLHGLDAAALHDIGISRIDALQEANKPFWRA